MGSLVSAEATRFTDAWVAFAIKRKAGVPPRSAADHASYRRRHRRSRSREAELRRNHHAKGASVLKQLVAFVGRDAFFEAVRRYLRAHAFVTSVDLLDVLAETSGRDVREWARIWLQTTGVSTLSLDGTDLIQTDPRPHRFRSRNLRLQRVRRPCSH